MLAQHGIHKSAYGDFASCDVVHDAQYLVVYLTADIDTLACPYLVPLEVCTAVVLIVLTFLADVRF